MASGEDMTNPANHYVLCSFREHWPNGTCDFDCADYTPSKVKAIRAAAQAERDKITPEQRAAMEERWDKI